MVEENDPYLDEMARFSDLICDLGEAFLFDDDSRVNSVLEEIKSWPSTMCEWSYDETIEQARSTFNPCEGSSSGVVGDVANYFSLPVVRVFLDDDFKFEHSLSADDLALLRFLFKERWQLVEQLKKLSKPLDRNRWQWENRGYDFASIPKGHVSRSGYDYNREHAIEPDDSEEAPECNFG